MQVRSRAFALCNVHLFTLLLFGCSTPAGPATTPSAPAPTQLYSTQLEDYVPAAGLRWLVSASPAKLAEDQSFRPALDLLLTSERLAAYERATGISLTKLPHALVAGFDLGTLYLAELPEANAAVVRQRFTERMLRGSSERRPAPGITVVSGVADGVPVSLVTLDEHIVAFGVSDPLLARIVTAYARGKLKSPSAFDGAALAGTRRDIENAQLSAFVPGPFSERFQGAAGGLLAATTALYAGLFSEAPGRARLVLHLRGDLNDQRAAVQLASTYRALATSSTGLLLNLGSAATADTRVTDVGVSLQISLPLTEVARGLRSATSADLDEIFQIPAKNEGVGERSHDAP